MIDENVYYFPTRVYKGIEDLAETIMNHANCRSSRVNLSTKDNFTFAQPEPVYITQILSKQLLNYFHYPLEKE
jgi:hypothetical protein